MKSVLDSWALIALLRDEAAAATVEREVDAGGALMCWINLGEVYYLEARRAGEAAAAAAIETAVRSVRAVQADETLVLDAARIKAGHTLAYADAFAVATAERHSLPLLTGDPEILAITRPRLRLVDLRETQR